MKLHSVKHCLVQGVRWGALVALLNAILYPLYAWADYVVVRDARSLYSPPTGIVVAVFIGTFLDFLIPNMVGGCILCFLVSRMRSLWIGVGVGGVIGIFVTLGCLLPSLYHLTLSTAMYSSLWWSEINYLIFTGIVEVVFFAGIGQFLVRSSNRRV